MDRPMRSSQIGYDPTVQQQKSLAVQISKLHSDGQITERRIHTYLFDDENARCCVSGVCTACKSSLQSTPRFTITSIQKDHSQNVALLSLTVTLLSPSGVLWWSHRVKLSYEYWCLGSFVWQHPPYHHLVLSRARRYSGTPTHSYTVHTKSSGKITDDWISGLVSLREAPPHPQ